MSHRTSAPPPQDQARERAPAALGTFAALSYPNYRLWFFGQMVSLFGTWMQITALGYLVYELTRSPAYLGYTGFASGLASWLFTLWGGVVADRVPRRSLLVVTQALSMLLAFVLAALAFAGVVAPWHIIVLAFLLGVVNAFDAPARQSFVLEMVDRTVLTNAIALNSTMFNIAIAVGPAAGGLAYALFGPGVVLRHQRDQLRRGDRRASGHAPAGAARPGQPRVRPGRHSRGLPGRVGQSRHPGAHRPHRRHESLRHVLRHPHARRGQ